MSKFDKNSESRTEAKSPLQQSSFVFFPEEEEICNSMRKHPDLFCKGAEAALIEQAKKLDVAERFLQTCYEQCAKAVCNMAALAQSFAQKLPQSIFGVGNGEDFMLPLGLLFEQIKTYENGLNQVIVRLDPLCQPPLFDSNRFALLESAVPHANCRERAEALEQQGKEQYQAAMELSEQIDSFCQMVIEQFFCKMGEAADFDNNGATMRFGRLSALCAELKTASERYANLWNDKISAHQTEKKGTTKP